MRIAAILAIFLGAMSLSSALAAGAPRLDARIDVSVVVDGNLPGFKADELQAYVVQQMNAAHVAAWNFEPAAEGLPANRVVWRFHLLPYAGGSVRTIGPIVDRTRDLFGVRRAIGVDARVYIDGQYQATTFDQATIKGGERDSDLAAVVRRITRSVIANAVSLKPFFRGETGEGPTRTG